MTAAPWKVVRLVGGDLAVAQRVAAELNGRRPLPPRCSAKRFDAMTSHVPMRAAMRAAVRAVLVERSTWREAAETHEVSESGILRALRRIAELNHKATAA